MPSSSNGAAALGVVRDVVHNYIPFTLPAGKIPGEKTLIDSPWIQRLRKIYQLQSTWLVYPCAVHTRFTHALGTMHLAGQMAAKLYDDFPRAFPGEPIPEKNHVVEVFRLAGLLHDVGHGPFSHQLDEVYTHRYYNKTHEDISRRIIEQELAALISKIRHAPGGRFETPIDPKTVTKFIKQPRKASWGTVWEQVFSKIMLGVASADAMDFLLRDRWFTGAREIGEVDTARIISDLRITRQGLTLTKAGLPAFRAFLQARFGAFRHIYFHEKKVLFDMAFGELLEKILKLDRFGDPTKHLARYLHLTDFSLHVEVPKWAYGKARARREIGRLWTKLLSDRVVPYAKVYEVERVYKSPAEVSSTIDKGLVEKDLELRFPREAKVKPVVSRIDLRPTHTFLEYTTDEDFRQFDNLKSLSFLDAATGSFSGEFGNASLDDVPMRYEVLRVYAPSGTEFGAARGARDDVQMDLPLEGGYPDEAATRTNLTSM
ncbi:HD domain-containing protein [bacterium]|nr:HD domain-containing protein [bacterium]